ncbi:glucose-1-phosphate adenylyltransferase subunit GlgD [Parablautia intestinalis]|jgi:glucose-1-phosphate adenylyltransferase|uniref:Glucose-1-phosphate adenylyltransferase subunit GlgD n=1 Tax=Parablautia intestinalis TaxID=2320100 RepID=A0A3A9ARV0_9FIRM|nr:glucose-1-phosphate adenylyltransferase subunit GlgD [Parablautia intestinalis]MCI8615006.1 glucose-1-phosphate adenylyltransferase subunit GlgD [Lachnospiraceae bacterium]MDE7047797.1 glucose-1-phosphate adenylyltransferase subunit GlgD [Lachnospiraceae bacterium]RKI94122.1 glucose-1-phosphate adenylyltransferase subunit GlgD [Parablautia intestinalis]
MMNSKTSALGIIFPNSYDALIPELVNVRLMASIPFASRYRLIDFILSSMANCGIDNISIMVNNNYHSLMDHLDSGREWDLVRKNGGLNIFPPYAEKESRRFTGRVAGLASILSFLQDQKEKYVVLSDTNIVVNFDFNAMIQAHIETGADVTVAYNTQEIPESLIKAPGTDLSLYYTFDIEDGRITRLYVNSKKEGIQNCSMNIYLLERELLIDLVNTAFVHGKEYFERDILLPHINKLNVQAYKYDKYIARICDVKSYYDENMKLLDDYNLDSLFSGNPIYTKIRDDNPTRYIQDSKVRNVMVADGCIIEGEVENSVIFRGVKIAKGAKVKNCILMQDTVVEPGAEIEYLITDKNVKISAGKDMRGTDTHPVYISKYQEV